MLRSTVCGALASGFPNRRTCDCITNTLISADVAQYEVFHAKVYDFLQGRLIKDKLLSEAGALNNIVDDILGQNIAINQLLQLCTARTAWSESDQAVRTVPICNSW